MRTETKQHLLHEAWDNLRWCAFAALGAALYVAIVSGASIALAQAEEIPILMLETRLPLIANEVVADWRCLGPGPVVPPQETPGEMTCELVP